MHSPKHTTDRVFDSNPYRSLDFEGDFNFVNTARSSEKWSNDKIIFYSAQQ